jgi:hypothetical protein
MEYIMAYTPELNQSESAVLRRIAWACEMPMTKTISHLLNHIVAILDSTKICCACRDKSFCKKCAFAPENSKEPKTIILKLTKMERRNYVEYPKQRTVIKDPET